MIARRDGRRHPRQMRMGFSLGEFARAGVPVALITLALSWAWVKLVF